VKSGVVAHPSSLVNGDALLINQPIFFVILQNTQKEMVLEDPLLGEYNDSKNPNRGWVYRFRNYIFLGIFGSIIIAIIVGVVLFEKGKIFDSINRLTPGSYKVAETDVYVTGTADPVIVLLPDIYGMSVEVKQIADAYAQGGFTAIVIDYFNGDPRTNLSDPTWNNRHPANLSLALANGVISEVSSRGYTSIQAQGYCYGGRIGVSLTFNTTVKSGVVAHPSSLVNGDALLINQPIFFVQPSTDTFNSLAPYFNATLSDRGIQAQFKIYPNTTHGFAVSATSNPEQKAIAMKDSLLWFQQHA